MVRNVDDLDYCLSSHPQNILEGLRSLCSHPKLVDVTLSAGGRDFPCHRGVLALCSTYFRCMFSGDFVESIAARVELHDVDPDILSCLLDFAYTGKLTINQSNVEGLVCTSSQLQFQTVRAVCSRYLQHQIDATNCLGILEFGGIHGCPEVMAKALAFLLENFEAVQQGEEFLLLGKDRLVACLSDEGLQIRSECTRVEAILKWVRHHKESRLCHLLELLGLSRLSLLSPDYLGDTLLKDSLVQASPSCREAVEKIHREVSEFTLPPSLLSYLCLLNLSGFLRTIMTFYFSRKWSWHQIIWTGSALRAHSQTCKRCCSSWEVVHWMTQMMMILMRMRTETQDCKDCCSGTAPSTTPGQVQTFCAKIKISSLFKKTETLFTTKLCWVGLPKKSRLADVS